MLKVLVVDDDESLRRLLHVGLSLGAAPVEVIGEATNGYEAIREAEKLQPDLIILDQQMPVCSGADALPEIRKVSPASQILFFSAYAGAPGYEDVFQAIARDYGVRVIPKGSLGELELAVDEIAAAA